MVKPWVSLVKFPVAISLTQRFTAKSAFILFYSSEGREEEKEKKDEVATGRRRCHDWGWEEGGPGGEKGRGMGDRR